MGWLQRPFAAVASWWRGVGWPARIAVVTAVLVVAPLVATVVVYLLPARAALALGKPVLALLSDEPPLPGDLEPVTERSVLLAADGSELATLFDDVNRVRITGDEIPDVVVDALLASEDDDFYRHHGVDHRAIMRAAVVNLFARDVEQGGSTLTQQLVKNVYLEPTRSFDRKITEAWYALELEDRLTKDEILERYLNETYFGQRAYGLEAAAQLYYGKRARSLELAEAALLVGIIPSPSRLNPVDDPDAAVEARNRVLDRMVVTERADGDEVETAKEGGPGLDLTPPPPPEEPFFVAYVRDLLTRDPMFDDALGTDPAAREQLIDTGGMTVHTTLAPRLQELANAAIEDVMGDPVDMPLATLVSVDPSNGAVRAMAVGPKEFGACQDGRDDCPRTMVNPAAPGLGGSGRQPGSAFKPFVVAAALGEGVPPGWEERTRGGQAIDGCSDEGGDYRPENYSPDSGVKDMREAVRVSNNVYHAKLAGLLGPDKLVETAKRAGLRGGQLPAQCSVALGSGSAFPVAMASAFGTFANQGTHCRPMAVTRIELGEVAGGEEFDYQRDCEERFDAGLAAHVTDLLQEPVENGTATAAQLDRPVAGKTGTTDDYRDAWFVGYVPQLVTASWVGFEEPAEMRDILGFELVTGGSIPAQLWTAYMGPAVEDLDVAEFPAPPNVDPVEVPDFRGEDARQVRDERTEDYTFNIETRSIRHWRPAGTVVRQRPDPGTSVEPGKLVTLRVSDGEGEPPRVPDVIGMTEEQARQTLRDARYRVEVEHEVRDAPADGTPDDDGRVVRSDPGPGSPLEPRELVTIVVARYREPPEDDDPVPDDPAPDETEAPEPPDASQGGAPKRNRTVSFGEVVADPDGNDLRRDGGEHVTIQTADRVVDVSGWTIEYEGGGVLGIGDGYVMPERSELAVHTGPGTDQPPRRYFNGLDEEVLRDEGGTLILRDRQGREVARVEY